MVNLLLHKILYKTNKTLCSSVSILGGMHPHDGLDICSIICNKLGLLGWLTPPPPFEQLGYNGREGVQREGGGTKGGRGYKGREEVQREGVQREGGGIRGGRGTLGGIVCVFNLFDQGLIAAIYSFLIIISP